MVNIHDCVRIDNCVEAPKLNGKLAVVRNIVSLSVQEGDVSYILWDKKECLGEFSEDEIVLVSPSDKTEA